MTSQNKLVRDKIPEIIAKKEGVTPTVRVLGQSDYARRLEEKLQEEVAEYLSDKNGEELADILEVVYALAREIDLTPRDLEIIRKQKAEAKGVFEKRLLLVVE